MTLNINDWTQDEKMQVLGDLLKLIPGPISLPHVEPGASLLPVYSRDPIAAGSTATVVAPAYALFKPQRLVICEPNIVRLVRTERATYDTRTRRDGRKFWRQISERFQSNFEVTTERVAEPFLRGNWRVHSVLVGQQFQFSAHGTLSGDAFAPDGTMAFDGNAATPGINISIQVENAGPCAAPFLSFMAGWYKQNDLPRRQNVGIIE